MLSNNNPRQDRANALRILALEAIEKAQSGHGGAVLGMAEIAETLWTKHLKFNPNDPDWINRDRFVLSNGHGSMLLYGLLHFNNFDLTIDDIKQFRQLHSKTPGHPEAHITPGVEVTTGPLGQGIAMAVGIALAEKMLATKFNQSAHIIDYKTWAFCGDGCLMEGVSYEACSLAGTLGLDKLVVIYDSNDITIDGGTNQTFTENVKQRFLSMNWDVVNLDNGHDFASIDQALQYVQQPRTKPLLIQAKTTIGKGLPNLEGKASAHANPVGQQSIDELRSVTNLPGESFEFPTRVYDNWKQAQTDGGLEKSYTDWTKTFNQWCLDQPELSSALKGITSSEGNGFSQTSFAEIEKITIQHIAKQDGVATRKSFGNLINELLHLPNFVIGSADLGGSTGTLVANSKPINPTDFSGNYIHYGVREFGMSAISNGLAVSGLRSIVGTFMSFSDYARPAVRMASIMNVPSIFVFTHDSVALGEDGPTHQPIEQLAGLRAIPGIQIWRPCDTAETASALLAILQQSAPACLILSRQNLPAVSHLSADNAQGILHSVLQGGYIIKDTEKADISLFASGSELHIAVQAAELLQAKNINLRVVSTVCHEALAQQKPNWLTEIVNDASINVGFEAGACYGFSNALFKLDHTIGIDSFGVSAPGSVALEYFGFTPEQLCEKLIKIIKS